MLRLRGTVGLVVTAVVGLGGLVLCAPSARADVLLDTFPGNLYSPFSGFLIGGPSSVLPETTAAQFTLNRSGVLDRLEVPIYAIWGCPKPPSYIVDFEVVNDNNGLPGATVLDTYHITDFGYFGNGSGSTEFVVSQASTLHPSLAAGTPYWLVGLGENDAFVGWSSNMSGLLSPVAVDDGSGFTFIGQGAVAYRLLSSGVPEPGTSALLAGLAVGGLSFARRRRR